MKVMKTLATVTYEAGLKEVIEHIKSVIDKNGLGLLRFTITSTS